MTYANQLQACSKALDVVLGYRVDSVETGISVLAKELHHLRAELAALRARKPIVYAPDAMAMSERVKRLEADIAAERLRGDAALDELNATRAELAAEREALKRAQDAAAVKYQETKRLREALERAVIRIKSLQGHDIIDPAIRAVLDETGAGMSDSIAKKLGAIIAPIEGGMPERLLADPDIQSGLLAVITQLRADIAKYMHAFTYTNDHNTRLQDELDLKREILLEARDALRPWADLGEDLEQTEKRMLLSVDCDDLRRAVLAFSSIDAALKETGGDHD